MVDTGGVVGAGGLDRGPAPEELRAALEEFVDRPLRSALRSFGQDVIAFLGLVALSALLPGALADLALGVMIGIVSANLFMIGHDAAHNSFTHLPRLNAALARFCFTVNFHPTSAWRRVHHDVHHAMANDGAIDVVWRPPTVADYRRASPLGRCWLRLTRSTSGFGAYYFRSVWWQELVAPLRWRDRTDRADLAWLVAAATSMAALGVATGGWTGAAGLTVVPFATVCFWIGFVTYFNHTHPLVPWYFGDAPAEGPDPLHCTIRLYYPPVVGFFLGNIMEHTAHHVHPGVPLANLDKAQTRLGQLVGERAREQRWTPAVHRWIVGTCKLYDPVNHSWTQWDGRPTPTGVATPPRRRIWWSEPG
ncbi:MAG: fatty acid desaturase [Actinomycetota bacterium]